VARSSSRRESLRAEALPLLGLAGAVVLWGTSFVATKAALTGFGPLVVVGMRMLLASAMMTVLWPRLPSPRRRGGDWKALLVLAAMWPCVYFVLEGNALQLTTASQAGTISALVPLLVAVGARIFLTERLARQAIVGLIISMAGVFALSIGGPAESAAPNPALGNALEVLAMVSYAVSTLTLKSLVGRYNSWLLTGLQCLAGAIAFLPALLLTPIHAWQSAPPEAWAGVLYLGLLVTLLPSGLYNVAVSRMPAGRAALAINAVPVVALISGWAIQGDSLSPLQGAACVAILGGVLLGQLRGTGESPASSPAGEPERQVDPQAATPRRASASDQ
jgi:drug/metabolite transporter (DMT)-like permease